MRALGFEPKKEEIKKMIADIDKVGRGQTGVAVSEGTGRPWHLSPAQACPRPLTHDTSIHAQQQQRCISLAPPAVGMTGLFVHQQRGAPVKLEPLVP